MDEDIVDDEITQEPVQVEDDLAAKLEEIRSKTEKLRVVRDEAMKEIVDLKAKEAALLKELHPETTMPAHIQTQLAIRQYLDSQTRSRNERNARRSEALQKLGGPVSDLSSGKAPIDAALSRRPSRGAKRPEFKSA